MDSYNVLLKDYGNGRKKLILYDKCITNLDADEKEFNKIKKECDEFGVLLDDEQKKPKNPLTDDEKLLKRIENDNRAKSKIYDYAMANKWDWFFTLTFSPNIVDRTNYRECKNKLQGWLKKIRERYSPTLKFLFVPELHEDGESWHFHGLVANMTNVNFEMAINPKDESIIIHNGKVVFNCEKWNYGFSECTKIVDTQRVSNYITKYITKSLLAHLEGENRYLCSRNLNKPKEEKYFVPVTDEIYDFQIGKMNNGITLDYLYSKDDVIYEKTKTYEYNGVKSTITYVEIQEKINCFIPATDSDSKIFNK